MGWDLVRIGSALHVRFNLPVMDWEGLLDAIRSNLDPRPSGIVIPEELEGASRFEADMLKLLLVILAASAVPLLPPG
jgi:hypothetical protein